MEKLSPLNYTQDFGEKQHHNSNMHGSIPFTEEDIDDELRIMHGYKDYIRQDHLQHNIINSDEY